MGICCKELLYALVILIGPLTFGTIVSYPSPSGQKIKTALGLNDDSMEWSFYNSVSSLFAIFGPFLTQACLKFFHNSRKKNCFCLCMLGNYNMTLKLSNKIPYLGWNSSSCLDGNSFGCIFFSMPYVFSRNRPK